MGGSEGDPFSGVGLSELLLIAGVFLVPLGLIVLAVYYANRGKTTAGLAVQMPLNVSVDEAARRLGTALAVPRRFPMVQLAPGSWRMTTAGNVFLPLAVCVLLFPIGLLALLGYRPKQELFLVLLEEDQGPVLRFSGGTTSAGWRELKAVLQATTIADPAAAYDAVL